MYLSKYLDQPEAEKPKAPEEQSTLGFLGDRLARGAVKYGVLPVAGMMQIAGDVAGIEPLSKLGKEGGEGAEMFLADREKAHASQKFQDIDSVGSAGKWAAEQLTEFAPQAGLMAITGGIGGAAGKLGAGALIDSGIATGAQIAGKKAVQAAATNLGRNLTLEEAGTLAANRLGTLGAQTANAAGSIGMETSTIYQGQDEHKKDAGRAALYGVATGILDSAVPNYLMQKTGITKLLPGLGETAKEAAELTGSKVMTLGQRAKDVAKIAGEGLVAESGQEGVQTVLENIGSNKQVQSDEARKNGFWNTVTSKGIKAAVHPEAWDDIIESMAAGGLIGVAMGGGASAAGHTVDALSQSRQQESALNTDNQQVPVTPATSQGDSGLQNQTGVPAGQDAGVVATSSPAPVAPAVARDSVVPAIAGGNQYQQFANQPFAEAPVQPAIAGAGVEGMLSGLKPVDATTGTKNTLASAVLAGGNQYQQFASQPFAEAPVQPAIAGAGVEGMLGSLQPAASSPRFQALQWAQQQMQDPATSKFERQNLNALMKASDPEKKDLVKYWASFTNQRKQPVATIAGVKNQQGVISSNDAQQGKTTQVTAAPTTTPGGSVKTVSPAPKRDRSVKPTQDDMVTAIAKLGGLNQDQAIAQWGNAIKDSKKDLARHATKTGKAGFLHVISKTGKNLDEMREALEEQGYLQPGSSIEDMYAKIDQHLGGKPTYSNQNQRQVEEQDMSVAPDGVEESDYPFDLSGINFPEKERKRLKYLKQMLTNARNDKTRSQARKALQRFAEKNKESVPALNKENKQDKFASTDVPGMDGYFVAHHDDGVSYIVESKSGNPQAKIRQSNNGSGKWILADVQPGASYPSSDDAINHIKQYDSIDAAVQAWALQNSNPVSETTPASTLAPDTKTAESVPEKTATKPAENDILTSGGNQNVIHIQAQPGSSEAVRGAQEESGRSDLETAAVHARAVYETVRPDQEAGFPTPGQVELTGKQKEVYATAKAKEAEALQEFIQEHGEFPAAGFVAAWNQQGNKGETEHKVALSPDNKTIRKFGNAAVNHTWSAYLDRIQYHNQIFGDTPYTFQGLSNINGELHAVLDQDYFSGDNIIPAPVSEIDSYLLGQGFKPYVRPQFAGRPTEVTNMARLWVNAENRVAVWDVRSVNVLFDTERQIPLFIDPMIELLPKGFDINSLTPLDIAKDGTVTGSKFQMIEGEIVPRQDDSAPTRNTAKHKAFLQRMLKNAKDEKARARIQKGLAKLEARTKVHPTTIDEEINSMSLDDMAALFSQAVTEAAAPAPVRNRAKMQEARRKQLAKQLAKTADAREQKRLQDAIAKLQVLQAKLAEENQPAEQTDRPEKDNGAESYFKKGDRVQFANGVHGEVVSVDSYTMRSAMIGFDRGGMYTHNQKDERNHMYRVRKDNGVEVSGYFAEMFRETDPAPEVVPAPVWGKTAVDPDDLLIRIENSKKRSEKARESAGRAKKAENINKHNKDAAMEDIAASDMQTAFDAWAEQHPEEAAKYAPVVKPAASPAQAAAGTGVEGLRVTFNAAQNGIELHFTGKPDDATLAKIKANGFRWARGKKIWYAKDTPAKRAFVEGLQGKQTTPAELTSNQQKTIRDLGPVGTKVQFKEGFNKRVYTITDIEPEVGKVAVDGEKIYRYASDFKLAEEVKAEKPMTNLDVRRAAGAAAFAAGKQRIPIDPFNPSIEMTPGMKEAWLEGWDAANLAAPVAEEIKVAPGVIVTWKAPSKEVVAVVQRGPDANGFISVKVTHSEQKGISKDQILNQHVDNVKALGHHIEYMGDGPMFGASNTDQQPSTRSASEILGAAAKSGVKGADEALKGLYELFGGKSLKSFPGAVDEDTYRAAKPHFTAALENFRSAGKSLKEFFSFLIDQFGAGIQPYVMKYMQEKQQESGIIKSDNGEAESHDNTSEIQSADTGTEGAGKKLSVSGADGNTISTTTADTESISGQKPGNQKSNELGISELDGEDTPESGAGVRRPVGSGSLENGTENNTGKSGAREKRGQDYRIPDGGLKREGSWITTAKRNLDIIKLVKQLEAEKRNATPEEQELLSKYTGFGASEIANNLFPGYSQHGRIIEGWAKDNWKPLVDQLLALELTPEELKTLARSTQYAHYTSEGIIRNIYAALESRGFTGGKILEPGMGSGNFMGAMPDSIYANSKYTGIEMDHLTAAIAKQLYPQQNIIQADYSKQKLPKDFFDLAIGNPPFADVQILSDPEYKKQRFTLHDYFFAKSLDRVRPGGLLVFITSRYTMDKVDDKARAWLAQRADLVGAVRFPQTAFLQHSGTEVVTDVLFLRKKQEGVETSGFAWADLAEVQTPEGAAKINRYFAEHPDMVLGRNSLQGTMYGPNQYTVLPNDGNIDDQFRDALKNLPESIYTPASALSPAEQVQVAAERDFNPKSRKEGGIYLDDNGQLRVVEHGAGRLMSETTRLSKRDIEWLTEYIPLRDAVKQAKADQWQEGNWEKSLKEVNRLYKAFVKQFGNLKEYTLKNEVEVDEDGTETVTTTKKFKNDRLFKLDIEGQVIAALESVDDAGVIKQAAFLSGRTISKPAPPKIETLSDALAVSIDQLGKFNIDHVAELAGLKKEQAIEGLGDLVYQTPSGNWLMADQYLSGNVVRKLEEATIAAKADQKFQRNVEALQKAQPKPLTHTDISVKLGATWLDAGVIEEFAGEVMETPVSVEYDSVTGKWEVKNGTPARKEGWYYGRRGAPKAAKPQGLRQAGGEWSTSDRGPNEILDAVLNNQSIKITRTDEDRKTYTDTAATAEVNEIAQKMRKRFSAWIWEDADRTAVLLEEYNKRFNNIVPRRFDGSHLTLPGVSLKYNLHPHQKRAIWRILQTGNTYLAHAVGAGKTIEMISAGMEMKRLGQIAKPLYVVPNHMLEQFAGEFLDLYPLANVMVANKDDLSPDNRRKFVAQVSMNNPDAVIITHNTFNNTLSLKPENVAVVRDEILEEFREYLEQLREEEGEKSPKVKQMENRIEKAEQRFDSMAAQNDTALTLEDLGCDFMFVDESHEYRKLDFTTSRQVKGIDPVGSKKAMKMYIATRWLQKRRPGRSHVFASGTPITNTIGELFTIQKFYQHELMEEDGIQHFDGWAAMFGEVEPGFEMNAAGRYEVVERFAKFDNLPELSKRVRSFMDVLTSDQLSAYVKRPEIKGGQPEIIVSPASEYLKDFQENVLLPRIETSKAWKPSRDERNNPDPIIAIIADGRLSSIDMRFFNKDIKNDKNSKLNRMIDEIIADYKATKDLAYTDKETGKPDAIKGGAQIVFYNNGLGEGAAKSKGFNAREWMMKRFKEAGIPANHIAWISDYPEADRKEAMFKEMRQGQKRILIGSAAKMGTGMNVQKRLTHLHYLDPPWFPAMVTQPDGRILRQGNQNEVVELKRYATKGSYDATQWQMVARKAKAIESFLNGDDSMRSIEDLSEANQFAMASALASGDERVIQLAGLQADVERLNRLADAHVQNQRQIEYDKGYLERSIKFGKELIENLKAAAKKIGGYQSNITGKVGGRSYDNRQEFGQALLSEFESITDDLVKNPPQDRFNTRKLGTINGFDVALEFRTQQIRKALTKEQQRMIEDGEIDQDDITDNYEVLMEKPVIRIVITDKVNEQVAEGSATNWSFGDLSARGLVDRLVNALNGIDRAAKEAEQNQQEKQEKLAVMNKRLGTPYPHARELAEKIAEATRLQNELAAEGQTAQPAATGQAAEAGTDGQQYSLTSSKPSGLKAEALQKEFANLPYSSKIRVVQSALELPGVTEAQLSQLKGKPNGMHKNGVIWLVADNLQSVEQAKAIALGHELTHAGQDKLITNHAVAWFEALRQKDTAQRGEFQQLAWRTLQHEAAKRKYDLNTKDGFRNAVKEATAVLAELAYKSGNIKNSLFTRLLMAIKHLLRNKLKMDIKFTDQELVQVIAEMMRLGDKNMSMGNGPDGGRFALKKRAIDNLPENITLEVQRDDDDEGTFVFAKDMNETDLAGNPLTVAHLHVPDENISSSSWYAGDVNVHAGGGYRRQGIASAMYERMAQELGSEPRPSPIQSSEGKALWAENPQYSLTSRFDGLTKDKGTATDDSGMEFEYYRYAVNKLGKAAEVVYTDAYDFGVEAKTLAELKYKMAQYGKEDESFSLASPTDTARDQQLLNHFRQMKPQNLGGQVATMVRDLAALVESVIPPKLKANLGKILSNPWFGSEGSVVRRVIVGLNLQRSHVRNELMHNLMVANPDAGYSGTEGLDNILKDATPEEVKAWNALLKKGDIQEVQYADKELKAMGYSDKVIAAYQAFHAIVGETNRVRFEKLKEISLLPYKNESWFDELKGLLDYRDKLAVGLDEKEDKILSKLLMSMKKLGRTELESIKNPTGKHVPGVVIDAYLKFIKQLNSTSEPGLVRMAFRHITEYSGEIDKIRNEWGQVKGYAPRVRKDGDWHVSVYVQGEDEDGNPTRTKLFMQPTITELGAQKLVDKINANMHVYLKGNYDANAEYQVEYGRNTATPGELLADKGKELALESLVNNAFDKAGIFKTKDVDVASMKRAVMEELTKEIMAQGFSRHGISREKHLIEGYQDTDYQTVLKEFISGMSGWLSKMQYAVEVTREADSFSQSNPDDKVWIHSYYKDSMKNSTYLDEVAATARSVGAVWYLGFKVSSAVINAFQNYTVGQAELARLMKQSGKKGEAALLLFKAQKDVLSKKNITAEELQVLDKAIRQGTLHAQTIRSMTGLNEQGFGSKWKKFTEKAMTPFSWVEQHVNREPAMLAAYRIFKTTKANEFDQAAFDKAEEFVNSTHYVMGNENLPELVRMLGPIGKTAYLFQGYVHNYLLWLAKRGRNGEFEAIARSFGAIALLGGMFALPGADDMDKWIEKWFGVSYKMKFKKFIKQNVGKYGTPGELIEGFINHGLPSVAGIDMSRALAVNVPFMSDPDKSFGDRVGGVWSGMFKKPGMALSAAGSGDYYRAIESLMPEFVANPMRAARQYGKGATTLAGKPIFDETGHQMKYGVADVARKALGFNPMAISERTELKGHERALQTFWKDKRDDVLAEYRKATSPQEVNQAGAAAIRFNRDLNRSDAAGLVSVITADTLRKSRQYKPDKKKLAWERNQLAS